MANHLKMEMRETILTLHRQGWSKRKIARELGVDRSAVRRALKGSGATQEQAQTVTGDQGDPPVSKPPTPHEVLTGSAAAEPSKPPTPGKVLTGSEGPPASEKAGRSKCERYRSFVEEGVRTELTAQRIYQDLRDERGFKGAYDSVRRMVKRLSGEQPLPFRRIEREPGMEAQADFGKGAPIIDASGKKHRSHVVRVSLSFSRKAYSEAFLKENTASWLRGWENAFWSWGGVTKTLQIDNTTCAVKRAEWYDPELHPIITAFCNHYGTVLLPIKVRTPRHNGKAERNVGYVKGNALKGRTFPSLQTENEFLQRWERTIADVRIHGTTKQQVQQRFEIEKPTLLPLPKERFTFFHEAQRTVHSDGHVEVAKAYYSVPPEYLGHTVWARWDGYVVRILNAQFVEIRMHVRKHPGEYATADADISSKKIALVESGATALLQRIRLIGPQVARWAETMLKERNIIGVRVLVGLLALRRKHSALAIDEACALACTQGGYRLRDVRAQLERPIQQGQFEFMAAHPIIRDMHDYGRLVKAHFVGGWEEPPAASMTQTGNR